MNSVSRPKIVKWLVICFVVVVGLILIYFLAQLTSTTEIIEVTRIVEVPVESPLQDVQIIEVSRVVEVPAEEPVEVTREVVVVEEVEVTRIVQVEVTPSLIQSTPTSLPASTATPKLYFSVGNILYQMDLDGSALNVVVEGMGSSQYFAVDSTQNKIYFSGWDQQAQIQVLDVNTNSISVFSDGPTSGGQGLAIDPSGQRMYLGLYYAGVYLMDMNNTGNWLQLVNSASLSPLLGQRGQLQIDPANGHIYFRTAYNGDCGECRYIWRSNFDGSDLTRVIQANGGDALALDLTEQKMYFSDVPGNYTVKRANMDGSGLETVLTIPEPYRFCRMIVLDIARQKMYMSLQSDGDNAFKDRAVARANMDGTGFEILYQITGNTEDEVSGGIALFLPQ